jgi:FecR protein/Peptidase M10 serralysin C terminal/Bacterial Ig-like domain (group 3)
MLVASGVEFGDACRAAAGELPLVIGNIQTAIGCGTISHAGGIALQAVVGDPVCLGDVIETAADGRIEIRFIDGTVFDLSRDTRVVLNEFARDADGAFRSALFAVTRGTFAFVAGLLARTGSLTVDTPVGSIRSRSQVGGIGMLSLTALTFALMKDAQAADPNVTFLDDDSIAYKDLAHGVFELVTKEAIPRHIIVEDPGETVVLTRRGSSVSVNQVANSPARMEELQTAQQDVLENFAKGLHTGSSAAPFSNPELELQPINFIQNDSLTPEGSLVPIQATFITVHDVFIAPPPPPPPPPPTVAITSIAGQIGVAADDIINAAEANAGVEITGLTSGVADGRIVTVTIVNNANQQPVYSGTATVISNTWSINLDPAEAKGLADGMYTLTADTTNAAGDTAQATRTIRVDETPPTIAIHAIAADNVVNVNAASTGFAIAGTVTDAENGQPVTVSIVDSFGKPVETFTTPLTNNSWSVSVSPAQAKLLLDGNYKVTADVSDTAGNPAPEATQAITVDETPPTVKWLPPAENGIEGTAIALGAITATVNSLPDHSDSVQSLVVSGIPIGAVFTDGKNCFVATSGNTSVDVESWNLSNLKITPPNDTNFTLTVTATDQDANTASASELVTVAPLAPDLDLVAAHGHENTAIALELGVMAKSLSGANGDATPNSLDTLVVSDIPVGATLSDGNGHTFTATAGDTSHDVASWNLSSLTITPPAEFEGCFKLTIAATERDSEGDISATATATELVTVAPVAEPPTAKAPATLRVDDDDICAPVPGVSVGPLAEDNDDTVSATLTVSHGTLLVASLSGVKVTGDGCATLTLSGNAAAVNTLLAGLTYTPTAEYVGCDTLHLSVTSSDGSNTYPTQATATTAITITEEDSESSIVGRSAVASPTDFGTVTSGAIGQIAVASAATTVANAGGTNTSLVLGSSQNSTAQLGGFTGDGTAGTLSASQTFPSSPIKSAGGDGTFPMTTAGVWAYTLDNNSNAGKTLTGINGNNWSDIIIGRFGADLLSDAHENNAFAHSTVAGSSAAQFDTIANFTSGTDKIDLTALGAFDSAVLALPPTSTSVPEHTIAWRFDSKANETIVYANPTDQTLSIGNSGLLEIHLPGIATIHSSDFTHASSTTVATAVAASDPIDLAATTQDDVTVVTTNTADVSSDATVSKGTLFVDSSWTAQTANIGDSFDATRDHTDSIDYAKFVGFDEGPTLSTGNSVDDAVTTLPSGQSTEPLHVAVTAPMQTSFTSDQKPVFESADAVPIDHGAVMHGPALEGDDSIVPSRSDSNVDPQTSLKNEDDQASIRNAGPDVAGADAHGIERDSEVPNTSESDSDNGSVPGDADEHATPMPGGDAHDFHFKDEMSGLKGSSVIGVAQPDDIPASMNHGEDAATTHRAQEISERGDTPGTLGDSFHFKNELSSSKDSGAVDLAELDHNPPSSSHHEDAATTHGPLAISGGAQALELSLPGHDSADHVVPHVQHDLIV